MQLERSRNPAFRRLVTFGGVAVIAAWSLLALLAYGSVSVVSDWLVVLAPEEWSGMAAQLLGSLGGPAVVVIWLVGTLVALGLMAIARRLAA